MAQQYGRWEIERSLAEGGQARTFLAYDPAVGKEPLYVLKRVKNVDRIRRFEKEIKAALSLEHPNLVKQIDFSLSGERPYLVTEYCSHGPLSKADLSSWSTLERLQFFKGICDGVGCAHSQCVVHRDLKPDNIFLKEERVPVVGDFGICWIINDGERVTLTDEAVGARKYTAPELADGRVKEITPRSDVYSLGKILYWLLAGRIFDREKHRDPEWSLTGPAVDLPDYKLEERSLVNELLDQSIVPEPSGRFEDANHFRANVERTIWRIQRHSHTLNMGEIKVCNFCGIGHYKDVANSMLVDALYGSQSVGQFGINTVGSAKFLVLWCNYCGHMQTFRIDTLKDKTVWRFPTGTR